MNKMETRTCTELGCKRIFNCKTNSGRTKCDTHRRFCASREYVSQSDKKEFKTAARSLSMYDAAMKNAI